MTNAHFCTYLGDSDERYVCSSGSSLGRIGKWCGTGAGSSGKSFNAMVVEVAPRRSYGHSHDPVRVCR